MRYPAVAGQFYAGTESALRNQIEECFVNSLGPGHVPELNTAGERTIKGLVSPHAGYMFSGPVAAHGFAALAQDGLPETFIVIGPNHQGMGSGVAVTTHDFETPLGVIGTDKELAKALLKDLIDDDLTAHKFEHSIEVQVPFIQYFSKSAKFVPICMLMQDHATAAKVGKVVAEAIEGRDVVVIASTDFSHYVSPEKAEHDDMLAIDQILKLNAKGLEDTVRTNRISMCGFGPVMAMIEGVQGSKAELLKYATSGDVRPMAEVVGYGSALVK
ncbi:MAG: extradiol dioxygenase [Candidatus Proteinoplasmatales archaeon SG8-5]|nr:MAG: extradiol dioxygenase [Candidatus Proteinoplasmatales archaeon SG8-5]